MLGAMTSDLPPDAQTAPYDPRTADRSPSGTGLAARLAGEVTLAGSVIEVTGVETGAATKACGVSNTADATNRRISFPPLCPGKLWVDAAFRKRRRRHRRRPSIR